MAVNELLALGAAKLGKSVRVNARQPLRYEQACLAVQEVSASCKFPVTELLHTCTVREVLQRFPSNILE